VTNMVKAWSAAQQSLALLGAAHEQGWTVFLTEKRRIAELATFAGLPEKRTHEVVEALAAIEVVETDGNDVRLTPDYAAAMSPDAPFSLADLLAEAAMMRRLVAESVSTPSPEPDALVIADAYGLRATSTARDLFAGFLDALPELKDAIRQGSYLDVGCGIAGFLLSNTQRFPEMRGVGIELVPEVAAEATRRTEGRAEIRCMDARDLTDENEFDAAFWAQPFFPAATRPGTLAAILRALRPGAAAYMQEMERMPDDADAIKAFALRRLVFSGFDVPFARTAEDLAKEAEEAGFMLDRVAQTPFGRIVIARKPS
jgi:SAM-dependent methyltransferase